MFEFHKTSSNNLIEIFGIKEKKFQKLQRDLGVFMMEATTGDEIFEGKYIGCKSPSEVLKQFITSTDTMDRYGFDLDSQSGAFIFGFAFRGAMEQLRESATMTAEHMIKKHGVDKNKLKKLLEDL